MQLRTAINGISLIQFITFGARIPYTNVLRLISIFLNSNLLLLNHWILVCKVIFRKYWYSKPSTLNDLKTNIFGFDYEGVKPPLCSRWTSYTFLNWDFIGDCYKFHYNLYFVLIIRHFAIEMLMLISLICNNIGTTQKYNIS